MNSFWKSSLTFSFFTLISRVFGYLRDLTLAAFLGAGQIYDVFVVIFRIPNVFRSFFGEGAMAQSLVPSIIEAKENINLFLNQIFSLLFFSLILFVVLVEIFPEFFVSIFAPGFLLLKNALVLAFLSVEPPLRLVNAIPVNIIL